MTFSSENAARMHIEGLDDESKGLLEAPLGAGGSIHVRFTRQALADWQFLACARFIGAPIQPVEMLSQGLDHIRADTISEVVPVGATGLMMSQEKLRWVFRRGPDGIVVHGIAQPSLNPYRKIWRYLSQSKALDLFRTEELYLRRLDLLADQYECRPTATMMAAYTNAWEGAFGSQSQVNLGLYENIRRALFVCCWQKSEEESAEMWEEYCPDHCGLAVQTTERQLQHQFAKMREGREILFFRDITYIDHNTYNPLSHGIPEQAFLKQRHFANEREIRFAWWVPAAIEGTNDEAEMKLRVLPDHRRLPFDLNAAAESVVFNPRASSAMKAELASELGRLGLDTRIRPSQIIS